MIELELGKLYNVRDVVKDYMPCNIKIGTCYVWKKYDFAHKNQDNGLRYLMQPLLNNMYRVHNIYSVKNDKNDENKQT